MLRVRTSIEIQQGVQVELLCTPRLYRVAQQRGLSLAVQHNDDSGDQGTEIIDVTEVYVRMIYCAAINAHDVANEDNPAAGEFPFKYADFHDWAWTHQSDMRDAIDFLLVAFTGSPLYEHAKKEVKKKTLLRRLTTRR